VSAGIVSTPDSTSLSLVLEPESAMVAAFVEGARGGGHQQLRGLLKAGFRVMVVDLGGGTLDVTVAEVTSMSPLSMKALLAPGGGAFGGTVVDEAFLAFVRELLQGHASVVSPGVRMRLLEKWEASKLKWRLGDNLLVDPQPLKRPIKAAGASIETVLSAGAAIYNRRNSLTGGGAVSADDECIAIPSGVVQRFFDAAVDGVEGHLRQIAPHLRAHDVKFALLVGGFSESPYVQARLTACLTTGLGFPAGNVACSPGAGVLVSKGAAFFGLFPGGFITSRVLRYSYGYQISERFNSALHDRSKIVVVDDDGNEFSCDVVLPVAQAGTSHEAGKAVEIRGLHPIRASQEVVAIDFYRYTAGQLASGDAKRSYTSHAGMEKLGSLSVQVGAGKRGDDSSERAVDVSVNFGQSEISVSARFRRTGVETSAVLRYAVGE